jgi:hypothetical protein
MRILVPEAHAMGSIACIRSLGRAGHHVTGMSSKADALGFRSRWCNRAVKVPGDMTPLQARDWLLQFIMADEIDLVLPSEGLAATLGPALSTVAHKLAAGPDPQRLLHYMSKYELFSEFLGAADPALRQHLPPTVLLGPDSDLRASLQAMQAPLFAKFDARADAELPARVIRYADAESARRELPPLLERYGRAVLQSFVHGQGVGVFFLRWGGQILGTLMHRRLHEVPHTGGVSSLRETWWDDELHADALGRIEAMDWSGVGMLEYRCSGPGDFHLMEFNARFWGSLHLALFAGVDFPSQLVQAWSGQPVQPSRARPGVTCRWTFPKEIEHVWSVLRDPGLSWSRKLRTCTSSVLLSFDPRVHSDLWFPGDRRLYWEALRRTPGHFMRRS